MKHLSLFACLCLALLLGGATIVDAYVSIRVPAGQPGQGLAVRWNLDNSARPNIANRRILYEIDDNGTADADGFLGPGNEFDAIQRAFANWRNVHESDVDFQFAGSTDNPVSSGADGRNVIRWVNSGLGAGVFGVTITTFDATTGEIIDADMELNDQHFTWDTLGGGGTQGIPGRAMIENVVTHEIGHMLGLDHSQVRRSAMYHASLPGQIGQSMIRADDRAPLIQSYPNPEVVDAKLGVVQGQVTAGGNPAFGVEVVLIDVSTGKVVISGISEGSAGPFTPGSFEIVNVPPGNYAALSIPVQVEDLSSYYNDAFTNFFPVLRGVSVNTVGAPTLVAVGPGQTVTGVNFTLPSAGQNPFEPDNNSSDATLIASGQAAVSRINPASDQDWYRFITTEANQAVTIRAIAHGFGEPLDPVLTLYDTDGSTILVSPIFGHPAYQESAATIDGNAYDLAGVDNDARIDFTLPLPGTYYFMVASRVGASSGRYVTTLEISGQQAAADAVHSLIEAPPGTAAGGGNFTVSVAPRNLFDRDLDGTFDVQLLDVTGGETVIGTITGGTAPFEFSVPAESSAQTRLYSARINGALIATTVEVSHYGALSTAQSGIVRLVKTLNAGGADRGTARVVLRDGGGNLLTDDSINVTVSADAGTLDNGATTGSSNVEAVFDAARGVWHIDLIAPSNTGTATLTAFADGAQVGTAQITVLPRAAGTGGIGDNGGGGSDKKKSGGGCALGGAGLPGALAWLALAWLSRRRRMARRSLRGRAAAKSRVRAFNSRLRRLP